MFGNIAPPVRALPHRILLLFLAASTRADVPTAQRAALMDLYNDCGGASWTACSGNWGVGDPCTNAWACVGCNTANNNITYVLE
jgi:hypothetical protein